MILVFRDKADLFATEWADEDFPMIIDIVDADDLRVALQSPDASRQELEDYAVGVQDSANPERGLNADLLRDVAADIREDRS